MTFAWGFDTLRGETRVAELPVHGSLPTWLSGSLVRNGPALFEENGRSFRHWFDGQAMLHLFGFARGTVSYANRLLDTPARRSLERRGRIGYAEFATDPCGSLFGRLFTRFARKASTNTSVNVARLDDRSLALGEVPLAVEFDPETLDTIGVVNYADDLSGALTTAHPHSDPSTGDLVNYLLKFGRHSSYQVYRQTTVNHRTPIGTVDTPKPGYLHSFAITKKYVVLAIFPLVVNPLSLLLRDRPFIENYRWRPELGTEFAVLSLADGSVRGRYRAPACFAFHHINAFDDGDEIVIDLCAFDDASIVSALYLDRLRHGDPVPLGLPRRFRIDLAAGTVQSHTLSTEPLELPRINYSGYNGRDYRYAYGVGAADRTGQDFLNQLCKLDVRSGETCIWRESGRYPGEPVFVAAPDAVAEDDGVLLSVVLDATANRSMLLVLDAHDLSELARAEVPHRIPFGFHGQFTKKVSP